MDELCIVRADGVARGNPGPAAIGVIVEWPAGTVVRQIAEPVGMRTNNEAEYEAVIAGLKAARALRAKQVMLMMDGELVARQLRGEYHVKDAKLKKLHQRATLWIAKFERVQIAFVAREYNRAADQLALHALSAPPA
ncbi:MAG: ribonuclease HI family protein [Chloroflexi bacterium]|nr:ribonuclease HI family protein [Chloroflexota bacterium]